MDEQETPSELGEIIATASYVLGIVAGYEAVAKELRERAGESFATGQDSQAHIYRDLAEEFEDLAKERRTKYDKEQRPLKEAAFAELEKLEVAKQ